MWHSGSVSPDALDGIDAVELAMALEEAYPDFALPEAASAEELIRLIRERLDDGPNGAVAAFVRRRGPSGAGGAAVTPGS